MTECFDPEVRDYLPDLVHGRLGEVDTATMLAHIEACDACARELALLREVKAAATVAPRIDVDAIVSALPVVTVPAPSVPARRNFTLLRLVAAAAIVISGALVLNRQSDIMPRLAQAPEKAESVSRAAAPVVSAPGESQALSLVSGVQELTDEQIETLLTQIDDIEAIPASEPDQSLNSLESLENTQ
jgi:anti-sigma factor RsiW